MVSLSEALVGNVGSAVEQFCGWLAWYGEESYDHQSFFAGKLGRSAKALYYRNPVRGTLAVAPMIFCEAFAPSARRCFWRPQRFPIADAHYAMGFAFLAGTFREDKYYQRAVHFLEVLGTTRCRHYEDYCWGYPFDWETRTGTIRRCTPLITTLPYVYEAFSQVHELDADLRWLEIMRSIARHAYHSYRDVEIAPDVASCAYTPAPDDPCGVINASAYRAFLLTKAGIELSEPQYLETARRNLNFVISNQNADGSWNYADDGKRDFVDHFHTCFILKALFKVERLTGCSDCTRAIERGVEFYVTHLFDLQQLPVPFSKAPRLTVYRRELYDYAECINLGVLCDGRFRDLDKTLKSTIMDLLERWQKRDGSFRTRQLLVGWDNLPMHRWAQSQVFRSLSFLLSRSADDGKAEAPHHSIHQAASTLA